MQNIGAFDYVIVGGGTAGCDKIYHYLWRDWNGNLIADSSEPDIHTPF